MNLYVNAFDTIAPARLELAFRRALAECSYFPRINEIMARLPEIEDEPFDMQCDQPDTYRDYPVPAHQDWIFRVWNEGHANCRARYMRVKPAA